MKAIAGRAEIAEERIAVLSEMENRHSAVESLITKVEEFLDSASETPYRAGLESKLLQLKQDWQALKAKARKKKRRTGRLGSELESKKVLFAGALSELKSWLTEARDKAMGVTAARNIQELQEAVTVCADVKREFSDQRARFEDVLFKGRELISELDDEDEASKESVETQLEELKSQWEGFDEDLDKQEGLLQDAVKQFQKLESDFDEMHFQETYQEFKSWIENEETSPAMYSARADGLSLETMLEELKSKQHSINLREREIKVLVEKAARISNLDAAGKENIESKLLSLQTSYAELRSKVAEKLESLQGENDKIKEFEAEMQHCRNIVQEIESVVTSDIPSFTDIEKMEGYVQELKGKFQDALAQRSAIFQLGEKKDEVSSVLDAGEDYLEVVDKWKSLLARFSEKIAETERRIAEQKELNESFEEVSSWMDNVEKEMDSSFESDQAQEVKEIVGQAEKLKTLNTECASYGQFVESLRSKVEGSPSEPLEGHVDRLSSLEARVEAMHKRLAAKLGDVKHCVNDVSDVTERISSCKEWLLQKKELFIANEEGIQLGNIQQLEEKLVEFQILNQEASKVLHDIKQAKEKVGQGVGRVSTALEESLSKELDSLCDTLVGLHEESAAKIVELEKCLGEAKEFEQEVMRYETLLKEAGNVLRRSTDKPVSVGNLPAKLGELRDLQNELNERQAEFLNFLETKKDLDAQNGVQERLAKAKEDFENFTTEIPRVMNETEAKISEYMQCSKELEESLEWLNKVAVVIDSDVAYSLDDTNAEDQLAKLKELRPELESFQTKISAIAEKRQAVDVVEEDRESDLQEKLDSVRIKWEALREDACVKEMSLVTFVQAKDNYNACVSKCNDALEELKKSAEEENGYSAVPEKYNAQLERLRKQQEKSQELEEQIRTLEEAGDHVANTCDQLREPLREQLIKVKDDWQRVNTEALIKQEQLVAWISEVGSIREDVDLSLRQVKTIHDSLQSCKPDVSDIRAANDVLGRVKQSASELDEEKANLQNILEKGAVVLEKLDEADKPDLEESLRALQTAFNEAEEVSKERVRQAEEGINDVIEFDKESARCESLLTIYQAAAPVDVSCTVETLEDQMAKLKRLYGDMESRESHMTALHEKEAKLSRDDVTQTGRTSPDGKAAKLQGDWGKLKSSVGEKLRELQRLAQTKKDFEEEYETCLDGVHELEAAFHEKGGEEESVDLRIQRMQELCQRIKSYRNKLDLLTDRCDELPNVAYEQKDLDPRRKLSVVVKRWEELKDDALGKLNELEKERDETQNIAQEISKLQGWVQDVCAPFVNKDIPPAVQRDDLEKVLLLNTEFRSALETKFGSLNELLLRTRNVKCDGQNKETLLNNLRAVSRNLEDAKAKLSHNDNEIKSRLEEHASLVSDLDRIRYLLVEVKSAQGSETVEFDNENWIEEAITSQRIELAKLESCDLLIASVTGKTDKFAAGPSDPRETTIEQDLRALTADVHALKQQLSKETWQLETLREFDNECAELLTLYETLTVKIQAVDLKAIAEAANVTHTEEELAKCRGVEQHLSERDTDFEALIEKEAETMNFAPIDRKRELEARSGQLRVNRTALKELIDNRVEALRNLVVEQQTLEGWLKKAGILIKDASTQLRQNEAGLTLDVSQMSDRSQVIAALMNKLKEYHTYSETFQGSGKVTEVARMNSELIQLREQLVTAANELRQFKEQYEAFETEAAEVAAIFKQCAADRCSPGSLQEAQEELAKVKVNKLLRRFFSELFCSLCILDYN